MIWWLVGVTIVAIIVFTCRLVYVLHQKDEQLKNDLHND